MKLEPEVFAEIVDIFRQALTELVDVSGRIRDLDLEPNEEGTLLTFTKEWRAANRRGG